MAENTAEQREFMPPPSALRGDINWQSQGWKKPWSPIVEWAKQNSPGTYKGIEEAENRLVEARKVGHESSKAVYDAKGWLSRVYFLAEESYHNSLHTRRS